MAFAALEGKLLTFATATEDSGRLARSGGWSRVQRDDAGPSSMAFYPGPGSESAGS